MQIPIILKRRKFRIDENNNGKTTKHGLAAAHRLSILKGKAKRHPGVSSIVVTQIFCPSDLFWLSLANVGIQASRLALSVWLFCFLFLLTVWSRM
jgi:hypothetical protein